MARPVYGCQLKGEKDFISLSGPVTYALSKLGLLQDKKLKGISVFNPVEQNDFKGKIYGGGLFLAQKSLGEFNDKIVFYDSGRELKKYLGQSKRVEAIEIVSRGKGSLVVGQQILKTLEHNLENCSVQLNALTKQIEKLEQQLRNATVKKLADQTYLFYLGKVNSLKKPNILIVNDGPVKTLLDYKILKSYPSELEYVSWSQKLIESIKEPIHIGLSEGVNSTPLIQKVSPGHYNITYRGVLTPGLSQILLIEYLIHNRLI